MSEHKAKIIFHPEVWKKIEWLTQYCETEIGALGKVKIKKEEGEKYFYVYELLFPKQRVTGATVHFTPEMWGDLLKTHGLKGLKDAFFYWHRHPGSSSHSGTDDEDTFETFMSKKAKRKQFIFLQTAIGSDGWNQEARIDLRQPIRTTIINNQIEILVEETKEEKKLRLDCNNIIKDCILKEPKPTPINKNQQFENNLYENEEWFNKHNKTLNTYKQQTKKEIITYLNNDFIDGYATANEEKVSLNFVNGQVTIKAGKIFADLLNKALKKETTNKIKKYVREINKTNKNKNGFITFNLQPKSKSYLQLKTTLISAYYTYCNALIKQMKKEEPINIQTTITETNKTITLEGKELIKTILNEYETGHTIDWVSCYYATICPFKSKDILGNIYINEKEDRLWVDGYPLVILTNKLQKELNEKK